MSTPATLTETQRTAIKQAKSLGFVSHLKAGSVPDADIRTMHGKYVEQDARRESRISGVMAAVRG